MKSKNMETDMASPEQGTPNEQTHEMLNGQGPELDTSSDKAKTGSQFTYTLYSNGA